MRRWETLLALLAVILASVGTLPIAHRLLFTFLALVALVIVGASRFRVAMHGKPKAGSFDPAERAARIREERHRNLRD